GRARPLWHGLPTVPRARPQVSRALRRPAVRPVARSGDQATTGGDCCAGRGAPGAKREREKRTMTATTPRWVHAWAVLTACLTLRLLTLGAEVTSRGVGMVDPRGFRWPWEILGLLADGENRANFALVIELTHRLFGFLVGLAAIVLCVALAWAGRG